MNPSLLTVISIPAKSGKPPLMMDNVPVSSWETAPFLITSTRSLIWVDKRESLRIGVRNCAPGILFRSIVEEVAKQGDLESWGNVVSKPEEGLEHLQFFGFWI